MNDDVIVSEGQLISPDIHDARMLGMIMVDGVDLLLPMELADGAAVCLALRGVERLRAKDFREGNIVLDMTVIDRSEVEIEDIAHLYDLNGSTGTSSSNALSNLLAKVKSEGKMVVEVNASYGCSLTCICSDIDVLSDWAAHIRTRRMS